jgi:adenylate cyclase
MPSTRSRILIGLALLCYCLIYQVDRTEPLFYTRLCNVYRDAIARSGRLAPANPDLVFLAIDADSVNLDPTIDAIDSYGITDRKSIEARAFSFMTQRFPWPREIYGLALQRLVDAGAKVVLFDLTFPTETDGDKEFRETLDRYRDHAVIGSNFANQSWSGVRGVGWMLTRPPESLAPVTSPTDDRVAFTNFWPDSDDVVRQAQYRVTFEQVEGNAPRPDSERFLSMAAEACVKMGKAQALPPDLEPHILRFTGPPKITFPRHSFFEIFVPEYWARTYHNGEFFRGKTVVVGAEGNWQHDELQTPLGSMPGPELHLNAINAALHGEFIREMPAGTVPLLTGLTAILAVSLSLLIGSPGIRFLLLVTMDAAGALGVLYVFNHASFDVPLVAPLTQLNATVLLGMLLDFTQERVEKKRVRRTLERYLSRDLVGQMLDQPAAYQQSLGGILKPVTILFSDIRGFTAVTTQSEPHVLVSQLNEYLSAMVDCVFRFEGTLDKFIGDAVMAVWGNIHSHGEQADAVHAVRAARAMRDELERLNESWKKRDWPVLKAGIAVHHGNVIVGNVGSAQRMEFTVIGEAVNVTWKLQEHTKRIGYPFVMSDTVRALVEGEFDTTSIGQANFPGLNRSVEVFTFSELIEPAMVASEAKALCGIPA